MLGLGAGGGIRDEEAGLGGGGIARLGEIVGVVLGVIFEVGAWSVAFAEGDGIFIESSLSLSSLLRENEGTGPPFEVAFVFGVASSSSFTSGSDTVNEGASSPFRGTSSSLLSGWSFAGYVLYVFERSHGGKAFRVASGWR